MLHSKRSKYAAVLAVAALSTATIAFAQTGTISPTNFVLAAFNETAQVNHDRIKFQTKGPTDVRVQRLDFAANSSSGWHHHPGLLIVAVKSGVVTLTDHNCVSKTYGPGQRNGAVFVEGGNGAVQASTDELAAEAYVTIIVPRGERPRIDDDPVIC